MGNNKSSQQGSHRDEVRGRNRKNREGRDLHEKAEVLSSDNNPKSDDKEQDDTKLKLSPQPTEVLPKESSDEASQGSIIQPADVKHLEKETEPNLEENLLVTKEVDASNSKTEEVPQTQDKSIPLTENKDKMDIPEKEDTKQAVKESNTDEVDLSQSGLEMVGSDSGIGKENAEKQELPATECNNEEEEMKEKVIEAIEKQELDPTGVFPSAGNEEKDGDAVELRKSPSFDFDISMGARPGESVQTPLLHQNKNRTRSPSLFDGSNNGVENLTQNEEKTIEVARSDSDRSRGNLLNLLKEEDGKGKVAVEPQKQDCDEKKGVDESWTEVALTEESGKHELRPSLLKRFLYCAAGIDQKASSKY